MSLRPAVLCPYAPLSFVPTPRCPIPIRPAVTCPYTLQYPHIMPLRAPFGMSGTHTQYQAVYRF
eukprot:1465714-Rhodomonas_salina.2